MLRKPGHLVYSPRYDFSDYNHVLSAEKYRMLYDALKYERWFWNEPTLIDEEALARVHTKKYLKDFLSARLTEKTKRSEIPIDKRIVEGVLTATQGTLLAAELALKHGVASNLSGGFHHSFADHAEGFCYLNDIVVAIRALRVKEPNMKVAVIDLDVHQGNGTAVLLQKDENTYTFSMHEKDNYPLKEQSSHDVELASHIGDKEYIKLLDENLSILKEVITPDIIFYVAGVDVFQEDILGGLALTPRGIAARDRYVKNFMPKVPIVTVTAGGYARNIADSVELHAQTIRIFHDRL
ncbi:MAG TPA: histone deacetylase [Turneriella sp.]|nr:histone deacetylase [Turneriella sp.]